MMNPEESQVEQQTSGSGDGKKTIIIAVSLSIIFLLILAGIVFLFTKKPIKTVSYTNPFASQTKTPIQNPFAQPTATFQNPFVQQQAQPTNKPYQNPFGGGQ